MNSRNTEKKRKGERKRSFKKRDMKGGAKVDWTIGDPRFVPFQQIAPSNPCEWTDSGDTKSTIFNKLIEYAYTNNTDAFIHTIQCCFGWKGHSSGYLGMGSNVSTKATVKKNEFATLGTDFLFDRFDKGSVQTTGPTLLHVAASWGNPIIIEILLNLAQKRFDYNTDPLVQYQSNSKIELNNYNEATSQIQVSINANLLSDIFKDQYNPHFSLYAKQIRLFDGSIQENIVPLNTQFSLSKIVSDPLQCELLLSSFNNDPIELPLKRVQTVELLLNGTGYQLSYDTIAVMDNATNLQYMPVMVKCSANAEYRDDKFCPYVSSGKLGTSSATGIISSESKNICNLMKPLFSKFKNNGDAITILNKKIGDVLFHYAFRDDQAAFNVILTCASDNNESLDNLISILTTQTQVSNQIEYTLLHIGAIYGNIKIVKPLIDLYSQNNQEPDFMKSFLVGKPVMAAGGGNPPPSTIECLYTRSNVNPNIFFGSLRKSIPSHSFAVQTLFNSFFTEDKPSSGKLSVEYISKLTDIYSKNNARMSTMIDTLNKLDAGSWKSKKSVLVTEIEPNTGNVLYCKFIQSDVLKLFGQTSQFMTATGNIAKNIGNSIRGIVSNSNDIESSSNDIESSSNDTESSNSVAKSGITYITSLGSNIYSSIIQGGKWITNKMTPSTSETSTTPETSETIIESINTKNQGIGQEPATPQNTVVIKDTTEWVIINNIAYYIRDNANNQSVSSSEPEPVPVSAPVSEQALDSVPAPVSEQAPVPVTINLENEDDNFQPLTRGVPVTPVASNQLP